MGTLKIFFYGLIVLLPLVIAAAARPFSQYSLLYETGRATALVGFMILILQPFLAGRFKAIEKSYGLDILIRFHRNAAIIAAGFIIVHPLLLTGEHGIGLLLSLDVPWPVYFGKAALLLVILNLFFSLYLLPRGMKFERWRILHDLIGPLILLCIFIHSYYQGHDLKEIASIRGLWIAVFGVAFAAFIYHRIIRPRLLARHPFQVIEVKQETPDVWSVLLAPPKGQPHYSYQPGQFQFLTFLREGDLPVEEHHWTISSSPTEVDFVSSTIKKLGDFTSTIEKTKPGDRAIVHAPFGRFSYTYYPEEKDLVFIAGGIGITPLRSMLKHMQDTGASKEVLLLYANSSREDIVFYDELAAMEQGAHPHLRVVHVLENAPDDWTGETGKIDKKLIRQYTEPNKPETGFYLCGPPGLVSSSLGTLKSLGIEDNRIHTEIFSFLD